MSLVVSREIAGDHLPDKRTFELRCPRSGHTSNVAVREENMAKAMALRWALLECLRA